MTQQHFEKQVLRYQNRVYSFAYYFLGDREEAQDVTQNVLLRFWKNRESVEEDRLLGWLLRVTRNACVDAVRKRKTYRNAVTVDTESLQFAASDTPSPQRVAERTQFREQLEAALSHLAEPYRSIIILRELQEMKYEEISGALNLPLNTVKVYLHRARKMLRKQLHEVMERETA